MFGIVEGAVCDVVEDAFISDRDDHAWCGDGFVADLDVAVDDELAGLSGGSRESFALHEGLEPSCEEVFDIERKDVVEVFSRAEKADACEAAANIVAQATTNERLRECLMEAARRLRGLI